MEYNLNYIKDLEIKELVDIVLNVWGFEETSEALLQLEQKDSKIALELGMEVLEGDKGDDYLQASVWNIIFNLNPEKVLNSLSRRRKNLGKVLLLDILEELNSEIYLKEINHLPGKFIKKIFHDYTELHEDTNSELEKEFLEFSEKVNQ